jgi:hypothetical protein
MKKTYIQPDTKYMVYDKEIMQLPIHNSVGGGGQLSNKFYYDEEEEEEVRITKKSEVGS